MSTVKDFIKNNYRHFNAASLRDAAEGYCQHIDKGGRMFVTLAGAMSTAELGVSFAEMIRQGKVHGICCTGANLEEDIYNLIAHEYYERIPRYRYLTAQDEVALRERGLNRVTDTCIPEDTAFLRMNEHVERAWVDADTGGKRFFPYEFMYQLLRSEVLKPLYQIDPKNSWVMAAAEKNLPIFTPGWEDSTMGNVFAARVMQKRISNFHVVKSGVEQMAAMVDWYRENSTKTSIGFFQIGGGIAGDFPICVVPLILKDLNEKCKFWGYFCQISDSTTSFGSYSGAVPNEKITWSKIDADTPQYVIESDATIVAPLIFSYVLGK